MIRILTLVLAAVSLAGCDMVGAMRRGIEQSDQAADDVQALTGSKPVIGFKIDNGRLVSVTVIFPRPLETGDLDGLTRGIRRAVEARFQGKPKTLVIGFQAADG